MINFKKNFYDFNKIKISCFLTSNILDYIGSFIILGITGIQINKLCYIYITKFIKSFPATLNYFSFKNGKYLYSVCISLNNIICHGMPKNIKFKVSDIINIDISIIKNGYFGDSSRMYFILIINKIVKNLIKKSYICMWKSVLIIKFNLYLCNIGNFIFNYLSLNKLSVVQEYCGHGVGFYFHEFPEIIHYNLNCNKIKLNNNSNIFTIEPIVNIYKRFIRNTKNWPVKTLDNSLSSQWEHTVFINKKKLIILTV